MTNQLVTQLSNTTKYDRTRWWLHDDYMMTWWLQDVDLSQQKALDADPRAIQQIIFTGKIKSTAQNTRVIIYYILEFLQSKEKMLEFFKGTAKIL